MKIYIVGDSGPEHNTFISAHKTRESAQKAWNEHRLMLLKDVQTSLSQYDNKDLSDKMREMYNEMIERLKEEDIAEIDCFPHDTPYIQETELME